MQNIHHTNYEEHETTLRLIKLESFTVFKLSVYIYSTLFVINTFKIVLEFLTSVCNN